MKSDVLTMPHTLLITVIMSILCICIGVDTDHYFASYLAYKDINLVFFLTCLYNILLHLIGQVLR